jgi:hypothetical protein
MAIIWLVVKWLKIVQVYFVIIRCVHVTIYTVLNHLISVTECKRMTRNFIAKKRNICNAIGAVSKNELYNNNNNNNLFDLSH